MKIAIDFVSTNLGSGTKTYNTNILEHLINFKFKNKVYIFITKEYFKEIKKNKNNIESQIKFIIKSNFYSNVYIRFLWMQIILPFELKLRGINKLFSPMNICPIIAYFINIKIYLGLHSNLPWKYFQLMPGNYFKKSLTKKMMELSIKYCKVLIVDSYFVRNEIAEILQINKKKIKVIYLGYNNKIKKAKKTKINYFLSVISCVRYHNIISLLKAYKKVRKTYNINFYLVMQILDKEYYNEIKNFIYVNNLTKKIKVFTNLPSNKLPAMYLNAKFYIFTSYCESFGLTTLEAMSYNCPVLVSNMSSLNEINGDAAEYFNPDDEKEIETKLIKFITDKKLRIALKKKSKQHLIKFSWMKSASQTLKIINNL